MYHSGNPYNKYSLKVFQLTARIELARGFRRVLMYVVDVFIRFRWSAVPVPVFPPVVRENKNVKVLEKVVKVGINQREKCCRCRSCLRVSVCF